jgi:sulfide:quinone oxidoreductase
MTKARPPKVLVLGSNFAGLTAALTVQHELDGEADVTVLSPSSRFLFTPSLIWMPFGKRRPDQVTFAVRPTFERHDVRFIHAAAQAIDPDGRHVESTDGRRFDYDYLVIATGFRNDFDAVPGLRENGHTITTLVDAQRARGAWRRFLDRPGDVVVGAAAGTGCFGAAYEFLFNMSYRLRKAGLRDTVRLSYVSAEPFLGHFGLGGLPHGEQLLGMFTDHARISVHTDAEIVSVDQDQVTLADGRAVPGTYSMIVPPFLGQQVISATPGLGTDVRGFVPVRPTDQTEKYDNVYAVGAAAAVQTPWQTAIPVGIPKTGYPTEVQARIAAENIAATVRGDAPLIGRDFGDIPAICVMDAGNNGVIILADKMLPPRRRALLIPGPQAHLAKLAFEKYYLWKSRRGYVRLP